MILYCLLRRDGDVRIPVMTTKARLAFMEKRVLARRPAADSESFRRAEVQVAKDEIAERHMTSEPIFEATRYLAVYL